MAAEISPGIERSSDLKMNGNDDVEVAPARRGQMPECLRRYSPDEIALQERKLVRKIDLRLMPAMIIIYILNYLDMSIRNLSRRYLE